MNPYYANWSYGYTLHPSSDATRGAYQVQYGGPPANWSQIKGSQLAAPAPPKAQVFVTATSSVKTETVTTSGGCEVVKTESGLPHGLQSPATFSAPASSLSPPQEDPAPMALLKLHELAIANKLVER